MSDNEKSNQHSISSTHAQDNSQTYSSKSSSTTIYKDVDKPVWRSTKATCFLAVLVSCLLCVALGAPKEVSTTLAEAVLFGLPTLLGAQGLMDWQAVRKSK